MLIDFHTHIFPDNIASRAIEVIKDGARRVSGVENAINYTDATYNGLLKSMEENKVDLSLVMPIVTNIDKAQKIIEFAKNVRDEKIISFASVHPFQKNVKDTVLSLRSMGFIGIKMHPEFQSFYINSKESIEVLKTAEEEGLLVLLHTGEDIGVEKPVHCTPEHLKDALNYVSGNKIIAAHMGGWRMWDEVEKYIVGTNVYLDTAFINNFMSKEQFLRIVKNHGDDKILFGSDSPWETPKHTLDFIKSSGISEGSIEKIKYKNALKLLEQYKC